MPSLVSERLSLTAWEPHHREAAMLLTQCLVPGSQFAERVNLKARNSQLDARDLRVRTLLHLPRVADGDGLLRDSDVANELTRAARQLREDIDATAHLVPKYGFALHELRFEEVADEMAATILATRHYLRSARSGSRSFALVAPDSGRPVSLCTVSPLEWRKVGRHLQEQFGIAPERVRDVSRVYSYDAAPPNAISYLLARVRNQLREQDCGVELLTTVVDPNLGFTGASYRAANWQQWFTVQARPYLYCDGTYTTPRQLRQQFGTSRLAELRRQRPRLLFQESQVSLLDSRVFCSRIDGETQPVPSTLQRRVHR